MSKKKTFKVIAWEESTWERNIEAKDKKEAEKIAWNMIYNDGGFSNWDVGTHGNSEIMEVEEL